VKSQFVEISIGIAIVLIGTWCSTPARCQLPAPARDPHDFFVATAPSGSAPAPHGLAIEFLLGPHYHGNFAEFRVRVRTANGKPSKVDRKLRFHLSKERPDARTRNHFSIDEIEFTMVLPRGKIETVQQRTLLLPEGPWNPYIARITEFGETLPGTWTLRMGQLSLGDGNSHYASAYPAVLVIARDARTPRQSRFLAAPPSLPLAPFAPTTGDGRLPDLQVLAEAIYHPPDGRAPHMTQVQVVQSDRWNLKSARNWYDQVAQVRRIPINVIHPHALPTQWRWYAPVTLLLVPLNDFRWLANERPEQFQAIRRWTCMGGNLLVLEAGSGPARREVASLLSLPAAPDDWRPVHSDPRDPAITKHWKEIQLSLFGSPLPPFPPTDPRVDPQSALVTSAGWGRVYAVDLERINQSPWNWRAIWLSGPTPPTSIAYAAGGNYHSPSDQYWYGLIPGVSERPVTAFVVVITVFSLVIGPVNFWVVRRAGYPRAIMMTIPMVGMTTAAFFLTAYVLRDGLQTRGRIRSVTLLDQARSEAFSWSRQSTYAAFAPNGFRVPQGTYVAPVLSPSARYDVEIPFVLEQNGDTEIYRGRMIASRKLVQAVVGHVAQTDARLAVGRGTSDNIVVRNRLGCSVSGVVLRDTDGKWHLGQTVRPGARLELVCVSADRATSELRRWYARWPTEPSSIITKYYSRRLISRLLGRNTPSMTADTLLSERIVPFLIEQPVERVLNRGELRPGEYAALVESPPFVPIGVPSDQRTPDLELVIGQWKTP